MAKNILVTGGAGFIGSNLCEELVKDPGNRVFSIDNYSSGSCQNHVPGVEYFDLDTRYMNSFNACTPDLIYHLGEYSRVEQSFADHQKVWDYNINGTRAVLEYARKWNSKLIYAGSSTKFGDNGANSSPYAWSKSSNTTLVKNYGDWYGLKYAITYFYNNYGPREIAYGPYATVIAKFLNAYRNEEKVHITAPGTQLRNFTHVSDTVRALVLVGAHGQGDNYGIGQSESYSIIDIANILELEYDMTHHHPGNRMDANIDTTKMADLGWYPRRFVKDYLEQAKINFTS
jgi:UDP-glucose 4-epimerase